MTEDECKMKWPINGYKNGHSKGYIRILSPAHPNASTDGYVYEHVYVMSCSLGRKIEATECVHHKNEDRADNRVENLQVMTHKEHSRLHASKRESVSNRPTCMACEKKINYGSKTGLCVEHYWSFFRASKSKCRVTSCNDVSGFRSGLCLQHVKHRSNKRRYSPNWDY